VMQKEVGIRVPLQERFAVCAPESAGVGQAREENAKCECNGG